MHPRLSGTAAGLLAVLVFAAPAAAAPTVTVRVEGQDGTLLERTRVTLGPDPAPGNGCPGDSAAAAIEAATRGNWDRQTFTSTILGETHTFEDSDYWAEWLDKGTGGYKRGGGICDDRLSENDEVLMLVDRSPAPSYAPTVFPLDVEGLPATAERGSPVTVTVVEYRSATGGAGEGDRTPVAGATVSGGGATATTAADGTATLRFDQAGSFSVKASKAPDAPSAGEPITVTAPPAGQPPAPAAPPAQGAAKDTYLPVGRIAGIAEGARFAAGNGPRELKINASDPSGIAFVKLRLTHSDHGRCAYFSGRRETFRRMRCGRAVAAFNAGEAADFTYLLPEALGRGRYVLDVIAVDRAGNRDLLARGRSRVVFTVR